MHAGRVKKKMNRLILDLIPHLLKYGEKADRTIMSVQKCK